MIEDVLDDVDVVMLMGVNPGFGGQSFIDNVVAKCEHLRNVCEKRSVDPIIEIDGGITASNAAALVRAGATCLVAGNAVVGAPDPCGAFAQLRAVIDEASSTRTARQDAESSTRTSRKDAASSSPTARKEAAPSKKAHA
jgi:ribulose-phosphate 3-epimerase